MWHLTYLTAVPESFAMDLNGTFESPTHLSTSTPSGFFCMDIVMIELNTAGIRLHRKREKS
jgi:hypothetical protein